LRLDTEKKNEKRKKLLRESMSAFIVSDSEEIEEEEDHYRPLPMIALDSPVSDREMKRRKKIMTPTYMCSPPSVGYHNKDCFKTPSLPLPPMTPSSCKSVSRNRKAMAAELFQLFNETVFDNKLPHDMEICWNKRLRTTAGCCINSGTTIVPMCKIELSNKVCDSYERIQDTLIHELCHAATWMIDRVKDAGHGPVWKKWTERAMFAHPGLNPITTKHNYEISYKFTYKCTKCDYKIGRHSKSVNLLVAKCPLCLGSLVLV
jgi:predicted SprT family Zn-dependent metalloprotease